MTELISIIVPIYNTKNYLERCVRSVLEQTYPHFELLLVDDGSEDGSAEECRALCRLDGRLRLLARVHAGVSAARNAGIEAARGKYLFFLDSDDTLHPRLLEALVELCETTGAALATELYRHIDGTAPQEYMESLDPNEKEGWSYTYMKKDEAIRQFSSRENGYNFQGIGGKMVRRGEVGELRFDEGRGNGEDTIFVYEFLSGGRDAVLLWERWYDYWTNAASASRQLSVQACRDMYSCADYIFARELERGREEGARFWAQVISARLRRQYVRSWKEGNGEVSAFVRSLARRLGGSAQFALLAPRERWKHALAFRCYPLYLPLHKAMTWSWRRGEKRRNAGDWNSGR